MGLILDISSYNGVIDWREVFAKNDISKVILRATTKNNELDTRFIQNLNGILEVNAGCPIDCYKFSYAKTYADANLESKRLLHELKKSGVANFLNNVWIDIEDVGGIEWTSRQCDEVISAYEDVFEVYTCDLTLGIYANYHYFKNIIPKWGADAIDNIWLARWTDKDSFGDISPFKPFMWQYSNKGKVAGIPTAVDLSRYVNNI